MFSSDGWRGAYFFINQPAKSTEQIDPPALKIEAAPTDVSGSEVVTFTWRDVLTKKTAEECWTIIDGKVYDITSYIPHHPGGPEVAALACGIDSTEMYQEEKAHNKPNSKADRELEKLYIGEFVN